LNALRRSMRTTFKYMQGGTTLEYQKLVEAKGLFTAWNRVRDRSLTCYKDSLQAVMNDPETIDDFALTLYEIFDKNLQGHYQTLRGMELVRVTPAGEKARDPTEEEKGAAQVAIGRVLGLISE